MQSIKNIFYGTKKKSKGLFDIKPTSKYTIPLISSTGPMKFNKTHLGLLKGISKMNIYGNTSREAQKRYLKRYSGTHRFMDSDGDGVINGLDCYWKDPKRHGFFSSLRKKPKDDESFIDNMTIDEDQYDLGSGRRQLRLGKTDQERAIERMNELEKNAPKKDIEIDYEKQQEIDEAKWVEQDAAREVKEQMFQEMEDRAREKKAKKEREMEEQAMEERERKAQQRMEKAAKLKEKAAEKIRGFGEKTKDITGEIIKRPTRALSEKLQEKGFVRYGWSRKEIEDDSGDKKIIYRKDKPMLSFTRPFSKLTGYTFETPSERKELKERDIKRSEQIAIATGNIAPAYLSMMRSKVEGKEISPKDYTQELKKVASAVEKKSKLTKAKREMELERIKDFWVERPIAKEQRKQSLLDALRKQEASKVNIARAKYELERMNKYQGKKQLSVGDVINGALAPGSRKMIISQGFSRPAEEYKPRYTFDQPQSGYFDINAPKFVYRQRIGEFTRKTPRVVAGDRLQLNVPSMPSIKKRPGSLYPWTKPMKNWERIYIGKGAQIAKGRKRQSRSKMIQKSKKEKFKIDKFNFAPFVKTYTRP